MKATQAVSGANNHGRQRRHLARFGQPGPFPSSEAPGAANPFNTALADALRARLVLTRPVPPEVPAFVHGVRNLPEAVAAAKAGDIALLDRIELTWLNAWGPRPLIERYTNDPALDIMALEILRLGSEARVVWGLVRPCARCHRRVRKDPRCRLCYGSGHRSDHFDTIYTDIDGNEVAA